MANELLYNLGAALAGTPPAPAAEPTVDDRVVAAQTKLEQAQTKLAEAIAFKQRIPYSAGNPRLLAQRHQAVEAETQAREHLRAMEQQLRNAHNAAAADRNAARAQSQSRALQEKRDAAEAQRRAALEQEARKEHEQAYIAAGGEPGDFSEKWPSMYQQLLKRRAFEAVAGRKEALRASGRYSF